jgi:large subunit ribosomal protein L25
LETVDIEVSTRESGGKRKARRLRRIGKIPGILYGPKVAPVSLELDKRKFSNRMAGVEGSRLVKMKSDSPALSDKVALLKEMQYHPISGDVIHADFYEVDLTARIQVRVPLHFIGKAAGVVRGGILQPIVREVEVECLPMDIPQFFDVEVGDLDIGDSVHIEALSMPEGVTAVFESNFTLVTVVPPTAEEAPAPAAAAAEPVEGAAAAAPAAAAGTEEKKEGGPA